MELQTVKTRIRLTWGALFALAYLYENRIILVKEIYKVKTSLKLS